MTAAKSKGSTNVHPSVQLRPDHAVLLKPGTNTSTSAAMVQAGKAISWHAAIQPECAAAGEATNLRRGAARRP